jgi:hypothetical protein
MKVSVDHFFELEKKKTNQGRFENVYHFPQFIQEPCGVKK